MIGTSGATFSLSKRGIVAVALLPPGNMGCGDVISSRSMLNTGISWVSQIQNERTMQRAEGTQLRASGEDRVVVFPGAPWLALDSGFSHTGLEMKLKTRVPSSRAIVVLEFVHLVSR